MTADRLRAAIRGIAGGTCLGVAAELGLASHWESPPQVLPFVLAALGLFGAVRGGRTAVFLGASLGLGGLFGIWEHLEHNYTFAAEIDAHATTGQLAVEAVTGGNPLLAPGAFLVASALLVVAGRPDPKRSK